MRLKVLDASPVAARRSPAVETLPNNFTPLARSPEAPRPLPPAHKTNNIVKAQLIQQGICTPACLMGLADKAPREACLPYFSSFSSSNLFTFLITTVARRPHHTYWIADSSANELGENVTTIHITDDKSAANRLSSNVSQATTYSCSFNTTRHCSP